MQARSFDVVVIGGGIVGLATGWQILRRYPGLRLAVLEKENTVGTHQTDRNSGVIHSGIYYKPGSAKATNCIRGYSMLLDFCRHYQIPFELCGKVIVAMSEDELPTLQNIYQRGLANGLHEIKIIDAQDVNRIEPYCHALQGIWVPQAGIIDFRAVAKELASLIKTNGGEIITGFEVHQLREKAHDVFVQSDHETIACRLAIACAGLYSDRLAKMAGLNPNYKIVPFRGEFYELIPAATHMVRGLIYPVPDIQFPFLGVHLTKRIHGGVEAGPNAILALRREGYRHLDIHPGEFFEALGYAGLQKLMTRHWKKGLEEIRRSFSKKAFLKCIQRLVPEMKMEHIRRSRSGVRAQALDPQGNMVDDYLILEQERIIHVCNAPSPAATSCLSIGQSITEKVSDRVNFLEFG